MNKELKEQARKELEEKNETISKVTYTITKVSSDGIQITARKKSLLSGELMTVANYLPNEELAKLLEEMAFKIK